MKQRIILISGFAGTGKTTIANMLHETFNSSALVSADELFHIRPFEIGEKLGRVKLQNCLSVITNFLNEGYENIICEGLVWSQAELDSVVVSFVKRCNLVLFWLDAQKDIRRERVMQRGESADFLQFADSSIYPWPLQANFVKMHRLCTDSLDQKQTLDQLLLVL
jgi:dephospho-CoA kinase